VRRSSDPLRLIALVAALVALVSVTLQEIANGTIQQASGVLLTIGGLTALALAFGPWLWRKWCARHLEQRLGH
jgi:hypothetical protein